jgi:hypothetical protein
MFDVEKVIITMTTNDRDHSVFIQDKATKVSAVSEIRLTGTKDDDRIRMANRDNAVKIFNKRLLAWNNAH